MSESKPSSRSDALYESLRARILSDALPAGARLPPERELAASYETNRNTLREAIRRLEAGRLVSVRQGQGVTVLDFRHTAGADIVGAFLKHGRDPHEKAQVILDLLEPRIRVLEYLTEQVVLRAQPEDIRALEEVIGELRSAERARDTEAFMRAQIDWHTGMAGATRNLPIRWITNPVLQALEGVTHNWPQLAIFEPSFAGYAGQILDRVAAHDTEGAVALTRRFHETVDETLRSFLQDFASPI